MTDRIFPGLIRTIIWIISWLPGFILYFLTLLINAVVFLFLRYRADVVDSNLSRSLPKLSVGERNKIANQFYRHFSELFLEMAIYVRLRPKKESKYIRFSNQDLLSMTYSAHQNIIIIAGHYGNWEWNLLPILASGYRVLAVYKPQSSHLADELMKQIRHKPGITLVPMKDTLRIVAKEIKENTSPFALLLVADQTPARVDIRYWTPFLGQDTAFFTGGEKLAKRFNLPVFYVDQLKFKFARYQATLYPLYDGISDSPDGEITRSFVQILESSIRKEPYLWLWTHRRWKYHREELPLHA